MRVIYWGLNDADLLNTLNLILEHLEEVGLYAAAHKCTFSRLASHTWYGKVYSQGEAKHDPERLTGLATIRRPILHTSLPGMAELVWPLRVSLEEHMPGAKRRTKRVSPNWAASAGE